VAYGKRLVRAVRQQGLGFFKPENIRRNFDWQPNGPPVHPPLGNWLLGWTHFVFDPAPDDPGTISVVAARFAPAMAFGLMVFLVGWSTGRLEGPVAGTLASAAVFLVPRAFGHAHLAALDTLTALFLVAAAIAVVEADLRGGRLRWYALAGVIWGLAVLTRLHGLLLVPPVVIWLGWRMRFRGVAPLAVWLVAGGITVFAGWPWLWLDPIGHLRQFVGTATGRMPIHVFYLGRAWADHEVPRHYAVVMFAATLPLVFLVLGMLGLWVRRRVRTSPPGFYLLAGTVAFLLTVFSWPGVPVYDGVRLFLMVFPLWAVAVGVGAKWLLEHPIRAGRSVRLRAVVLGGLVALEAVGLVLHHPCYLSYYGVIVGGLPGAERLGFEVNYWGDAVTESLLSAIPEKARGSAVAFGPNLAPFQAPMVAVCSASLSARKIGMVGWESGRGGTAEGHQYAVFYNRRADLAEIAKEMPGGKVLKEQRVLGVWTARVVEFPVSPRRIAPVD
jgi:4-amino-4-deoxy-L-arabinose transferase-like glycosyltransferase